MSWTGLYEREKKRAVRSEKGMELQNIYSEHKNNQIVTRWRI